MDRFRVETPVPSLDRHFDFMYTSDAKEIYLDDSTDAPHIVSPANSPTFTIAKSKGDHSDVERIIRNYERLREENERLEENHAQQLLSMRRVMADITIGRDEKVVKLQREIESLRAENQLIQQKQLASEESERSQDGNLSDQLKSNMEQQIEQQEQKIQSLEKSLKQATESQAGTVKELISTKESLEKSLKNLASLEESKSELNADLNAKIEQLDEHVENLECALKELGKEIPANSSKELDETQSQLSIIREALTKANEEARIVEEQLTAEVGMLQEQRLADQNTIEALLVKIESIEAEVSKAREELQFKNDAIENAENIMAFLEEEKEEMKAKYESELSEKNKLISDLTSVQTNLKVELDGQRQIYDLKLKQSNETVEQLLNEKLELKKMIEKLEQVLKEKSGHGAEGLGPGRALFHAASNISDFLFNCGDLGDANINQTKNRRDMH